MCVTIWEKVPLLFGSVSDRIWLCCVGFSVSVCVRDKICIQYVCVITECKGIGSPRELDGSCCLSRMFFPSGLLATCSNVLVRSTGRTIQREWEEDKNRDQEAKTLWFKSTLVRS